MKQGSRISGRLVSVTGSFRCGGTNSCHPQRTLLNRCTVYVPSFSGQFCWAGRQVMLAGPEGTKCGRT
jgi:hypothetical protein